MTDNDIIEAFKCCNINCDCLGCPNKADRDTCKGVGKEVLDLINRQKAEIESLKDKLNHSIGTDNTKENGYFPFD